VSEEAHWTYIALAYGATFAIMGFIAWRIVREHRRLTAELARFDDKGEEL